MINLNKREILLPNNNIIKRKLYSRYIANNSPSWVQIKGINFFVEYDENHNIIPAFCDYEEFNAKYPDWILKGEEESRILHVDKWYFDRLHDSIVKPEFWELVKN